MEVKEDNNNGRSSDHDWAEEVAAFEEAKSGVKGIADSGILKIPTFFIQAPSPESAATAEDSLEIPTVDLHGVATDPARRKEAVEAIRDAAGNWGFFRMVGHGVPAAAVEGILEDTRRFHELPAEEKKPLYSSDARKNPRFYTINGAMEKGQVANWRDALGCNFLDGEMDSESLPLVCRKGVGEYMKHLIELMDVLCGLLSEALGLNPEYLSETEFFKSQLLSCIYYPPCPEPDRTFGLFKHSDTTFLTIVVQDDIGGLQVLHQDHWVDATPVPGSLLANIGDLMQLISNDKFKSVEHRVLARSTGTRVSAACFFYPGAGHMMKPFGPIKELLSETNPPLYREVTHVEYLDLYQKTVRYRIPTLPKFKL